MNRKIIFENIVVIDIETASCFARFDDMDNDWQELWAEKIKKILPEEESVSTFYQKRAGVMAEFGKIICICYGEFESEQTIHLKSICHNDEKLVLKEFVSQMNEIRKKKEFILAGHNIKEFDIPFICRRMIINKIPIPVWLNFQNTKPWENNIYDTFQYWRFGDYKNYTSLKLLSKLLQIDSSKDDIDGSMVGALYWESDPILQALNLKRIETYCKKDVESTAAIIGRLLDVSK